jgi:hypothetical protein
MLPQQQQQHCQMHKQPQFWVSLAVDHWQQLLKSGI